MEWSGASSDDNDDVHRGRGLRDDPETTFSISGVEERRTANDNNDDNDNNVVVPQDYKIGF